MNYCDVNVNLRLVSNYSSSVSQTNKISRHKAVTNSKSVQRQLLFQCCLIISECKEADGKQLKPWTISLLLWAVSTNVKN